MHLSFLRKVHNSVFRNCIFCNLEIEFRQIVHFRLRTIRHLVGTYTLHTYHRHPLREDAKLSGCSVRQVNDSATPARTAVGNPNNDFLAIVLVGDTQ